MELMAAGPPHAPRGGRIGMDGEMMVEDDALSGKGVQGTGFDPAIAIGPGGAGLQAPDDDDDELHAMDCTPAQRHLTSAGVLDCAHGAT
jgi:hypothetical protein